MRKLILCFNLILFMSMFFFSNAFADSLTILNSDNDYIFPHKNDRQENLALRGRESFGVKWQATTSGATSLVSDKEGTLYFSDYTGVYASDPNGNVLWQKSFASSGLLYLHIGYNDNLFVFTNPTISSQGPSVVYCLEKDTGKLKWLYTFKDYKTPFLARYTSDPNGSFIIETDGQGIISINSTGVINWIVKENVNYSSLGNTKFTTSNISHMYTDSNGNTLVLFKDNTIMSINSLGSVIWRRVYEELGNIQVSGNKIFSISNKGLRAFDSETGSPIDLTPELFEESLLVLPSDKESSFYINNPVGVSKIDQYGNEKWNYEIREIGFRSASGITSDNEGNVFFSNSGSTVYSLDKNGGERFILFIQDGSSSSSKIVAHSNGLVYALSYRLGIYAIGRAENNVLQKNIIENVKTLNLEKNTTVFFDTNSYSVIETPNGWKRATNKPDNFFLFKGDQYTEINSYSRSDFVDSFSLDEDIKTIQANIRQSATDNAVFGPIMDLNISGFNAKQFVAKADYKNMKFGYLITVIHSKQRIYEIISWTFDSKFELSKEDFTKISNSLSSKLFGNSLSR